MNTDKLAKHYTSLTPRERFPLIMAASGRDDEQERQKLTMSAPKVAFRTPDYFGLAQAFSEVSFLHLIELTHLAATCLETLAAADDVGDKHSPRLLDIALAFGYLFNVNLAGWRQFCVEDQLDPELCWSLLPGFDRIKRVAELTETTAFTPEGMVRFLARKDEEPGQPVTANLIAASLRKCLEIRTEWWG